MPDIGAVIVTEPYAPPPRRTAAVSRRVALARLAIFWEGVLVRTWRGASLAALALGLSLMGLWTWLPGPVHVALLAAFAVAVPLVVWRDLRDLRWPGEDDALRRLERESGFAHRPLQALEDEFAGDERDRASKALFEIHRQRMAGHLRAIRVGLPRSRVAASDRFALRAAACLVLALGTLAGWPHAQANLAAALAPDFSSGAAPGARGDMTMWITPPAYTGIPPIWLDAVAGAQQVSVPVGSELVVQLRGGDGAPELRLDDESEAFEEAGPGSFQIARVLDRSGRYAVVRAGRELTARTIAVTPDEPPSVTLVQPPSETLRTALRLDVAASDDYGLAGLHGAIRLPGDPSGETLELSVPLAQKGVREMRGPAFYNVMAHPWAGMDAELVLTAVDMIGQSRDSEVYGFTMPERFFLNPVARRLGDQRKLLAVDSAKMAETAQVLEGISRDPPSYLDDVGVHLALVTGARRLAWDPDRERARDAVVALMWDTAVSVEEGPLAFAEERVRALQEELLKALAEGAPEDVIDRLLDELRLAMDDYMRALASRLRADPGDLFSPTEALKAVGSRELTDLVDRIGDLVRSGSRSQAQSLLTRLQEIMENIAVGNLSDLTGSVSAEAVEMLHTIRQIMTDQQDLLDESFRMVREDGPEGSESGPQADAQEDVRTVLEGLMERMEGFGYETPRTFPRAGRSMKRAVRQLRADRPSLAVDHQSEAVNFLRSGTDDLMRQMLDQAGEATTGGGQNFFTAPRDPVGRRLGNDGNTDTSGLELTDRGSIMRVREILDELYRRSAEQHRPAEEQDYLRRLLRRF